MIAVFSDLHDNLANLEEFDRWCQGAGISQALFCGDLTNAETLKELAKKWSGELYFIQGNADNYAPEDVPELANFHNLGRYGRVVLAGRTIGLCHEPQYQETVLEQGPVEVLFYGHTHKPWQEEKTGVWLVNPGTLGGVYYPASFALYNPENNTWELKILNQLA